MSEVYIRSQNHEEIYTLNGSYAIKYKELYGNNLIEIWEYKGERKGRCICKVKEDTEIACYQRAIEMLENYSGKETVKHEKRAG